MEQDVKTEWMEISPEEFRCDAFQVWGDNWLALAAGDFEEKRFNAMTVGWGFFGTMWAAPAVMVVVRPQRYTLEFTGKEFLEKSLVSRMYPERDFHVFLLGEVVRIAGVSKYVKP